MTPQTNGFPALLQNFFQRRLIAERGVSAHTIASYRDTFELLLRYAQERTGRTPSALRIEDIDAPLVLAFLDHLESERGNSPRTRNLRLTAIRSFMRHASLRAPDALPVAGRVLAISSKRFDRPALEFLSHEEVEALLAAPDRSTWSGRRGAVLLSVMYNSGARVSELVGLRVADVLLDRACALLLHGKGRICGIRHILPYVAPRTMSRRRSERPPLGGDRACWLDIFRSGQRLSRNASRGSGGR